MDQETDWLTKLQSRTRSEHTEWRIRKFARKARMFIRISILLAVIILLESFGFWVFTRK